MSETAPGTDAPERHRSGPEDRVLPFTRVLAFVIIPFLVAAAFLLLVLPGATEQHFAWTIQPPMTAMLLGSAYAGGIWFFVQVAVQRRWHRVRHGFPAVLVFATLLAIATFLHWDRFHFGHISFITWVALYISTPVLVLVALVLNLREDDGMPEGDDIEIPGPWRYVLALVGAVLTLPGLVNVWMLWDDRWSAFRRVFQAQLVSLACIVLAIAVRLADFDWNRPSAWLFAIGIVVSAAVYALFYFSLERRATRSV